MLSTAGEPKLSVEQYSMTLIARNFLRTRLACCCRLIIRLYPLATCERKLIQGNTEDLAAHFLKNKSGSFQKDNLIGNKPLANKLGMTVQKGVSVPCVILKCICRYVLKIVLSRSFCGCQKSVFPGEFNLMHCWSVTQSARSLDRRIQSILFFLTSRTEPFVTLNTRHWSVLSCFGL